MQDTITNLSNIHHHYNGFIVDIWGVLHDGNEAFPEAIECLNELRLLNKKVILFSNAPRRATSVEQILAQKNINKNHYQEIISSGELVFESLKNDMGKKYFFIGPERDALLLDGSNHTRVSSILDAEFIIVTGINENLDEEPFSKELLIQAKACNLPLICANPDLYVLKNGKKILCAGTIAEYYKNLNGDVLYQGKPYNSGYTRCQEALNLPKNQILAIGDSYKTDITGANHFGIDSLLITSGVDRDLFIARSNSLLDIDTNIPKSTFVMDRFKW